MILSAWVPGRSEAQALPGPAHLFTGLVDDPEFEWSTDPVRTFWLTRARQLGSTMVRIDVNWSGVAPAQPPAGFRGADPADPDYNWAELDATIREAAAQHQRVLLMLHDAPTWAEAPKPPSYVAPGAWDPNPVAYGAFAHAVALRYSGRYPDPSRPGHDLPHVGDFEAWNEPNLPNDLMPQWVTGPHQSIVAASPGIYRALLNALYAGVKAAQPHGFVVAGATAPYGDPPGVDRMAPLVFLRGLFCLSPDDAAQRCPDPPHFDALGHHPYSTNPTDHAKLPDDVGMADLGKLWSILRVAERVGHALPAGHKSLWVDEINWSTGPRAQTAITTAHQARNLSEAFYEFWRQGVSRVFWFELRDPAGPLSNATGGGLYWTDGAAKPAATAFRFPFVALLGARGRRTVWGRAPAAGTVVIDRRRAGRWQPLLRLRTTSGGIFYAHPRVAARVQLRAAIGAITSLGWSTGPR